MPELVFFRRGEEVLRVAVDRARVVLGRGDSSDVAIPDPEVSRQQVALLWDGQKCRVEDLSGKGTKVAGAVVERGDLPDGADLELGQWRAVFRQHGASEDADAATEAGNATSVQGRDAQRWQPAQLRVKQGGTEAVHRLTGDSFTVGKDAGNDLVLQDRFISGRHLKVSRKDGVFHVVDLRSTNGTWLGPVRLFEAEVTLPTSLRVGEAELVLEAVPAAKKEAQAFHGILGSDPSVRQLTDLIQRVAPSTAAVTILGESGTGKELVANALHACSPRANRPLIPVNCAAISKELIESELFGHEKGAFTGSVGARKGAFEEADGGTLFLDEIGELPLDLQAKLLRALESGEIKRVGASRPLHVDVRVVAATNRDLLAAAREGRFREDLYYRLCVVPLHLPPLRNRRGDVVALAEHFVRAFAPRGQTVRFTQAALERLQQHAWPGNIRELRNVVHRALLLRKGPSIDGSDLSFDQEVNRETGITVPELPPGMTLEQMLEKLERQIIETALRRFNNNRERVARELGLARSTLFKRLKDWGLTKQDEQE
ncbi:sigma 54-interacting transcriptional regulator [Corallococcus caeni]|uniref:FHA domain-containing protein n=1 Tax=Corallococcus caeni TaxID=3082388 RepID=A0ABQ6QWY4_9BACT|nr:hypothetical protein ASNO1_45540 [Corallococcus sp. NO1]